jgi:hypothetical protein
LWVGETVDLHDRNHFHRTCIDLEGLKKWASGDGGKE